MVMFNLVAIAMVSGVYPEVDPDCTYGIRLIEDKGLPSSKTLYEGEGRA